MEQTPLQETAPVPLGTFLTNRFDDRYLYEVNRNTFNRIGSKALYRSRFGESLRRENTLNIIFGTDSGLLPTFLLQHACPAGSRFLFLELPEVLARLPEVLPLPPEGGAVAVVSCDNWREEAEKMELIDYLFVDGLRLFQSFAAEDDSLGIYRPHYWQVHQELEALAWETNANLGTEDFILRQLENLGENRHPATLLNGLFSGKTAVLLGGGPSLDQMLPWLQDHRQEVVVLAVSRISRRLQQVGLAPDIVFSIDPQPVSFHVSKEMLQFWEQALFINYFHVSPQLLSQWRGRSLFLGERVPWSSPLNPPMYSTPGPTVTNVALAAAVEMGFAQVLLGGVDLCFSREGYSHARGSYEQQAGPQIGDLRPLVETNGGWLAETDPAYAHAAGVLGRQSEEAARRGCAVINPAAGAARMQGILHCPLERISIESLARPVSEMIRAILPVDDAEARSAHYRQMLDELARANGRLRQIRRLACAALECNDGLFGRQGKKADFKYKLRMDKIEGTLNGNYTDFIPLVKKFGIRSFLKATRPDPDREWSDAEIEKAGRLYYEAYRDSADRLLQLVETHQKRLRGRLAEEENPHLAKLAEQWQRDGQPGRALVWRAWHPEAYAALPEDARGRIADMESAFARLLAGIETEHQQLCQLGSDLTGLRGKVATLFRNRDAEGLQRTFDVLGALQQRPEAALLGYLVSGYLAELNGDVAGALAAYQELLSTEVETVLEDALRRVLSISLDLNDAENARGALECLVAISPVYLPHLAELLRLIGNNRRALDTWADYLERVPNDTSAMLKLGRFYQELGIEEGARLMFRQVLDTEPENQAAGMFLAQLAKG